MALSGDLAPGTLRRAMLRNGLRSLRLTSLAGATSLHGGGRIHDFLARAACPIFQEDCLKCDCNTALSNSGASPAGAACGGWGAVPGCETEYQLVRLGDLADRRDREQVVAFADWCRGEKYDFVTIVSVAFTLLFGGKFDFGMDGETICSGLVARALERTNAIFDRTPSHMMPADLAWYFNVTPPPKGTPKGVIPRP